MDWHLCQLITPHPGQETGTASISIMAPSLDSCTNDGEGQRVGVLLR